MSAPALACPHVAAPGPRCATEVAPGRLCGHPVELHDLAGDNTTRKACSVSTGRQAQPCGCKKFEPAPEVS